jgi:hypothetical protein
MKLHEFRLSARMGRKAEANIGLQSEHTHVKNKNNFLAIQSPMLDDEPIGFACVNVEAGLTKS